MNHKGPKDSNYYAVFNVYLFTVANLSNIPTFRVSLMAAENSLAYRIHLHERGPTSAEGIKHNLKSEEVPKPQPGPGQVLVRMKAAALNCRSI